MEKGTEATVRKALRERPPLDLRRMSSIPGDDDGRDGESDDCDGNGERKSLYLRRSWSMPSVCDDCDCAGNYCHAITITMLIVIIATTSRFAENVKS